MEEDKKESYFQNRRIVSEEGKNLVNLRREKKVAEQSYEGDEVERAEGYAEQPAESFRGQEEASAARPAMNVLDRIVEKGLYLLVFLVPLLVSPFSFEAHEFNKAFFLVFMAAFLFFVWTINGVFVKHRLQFLKSSLTLPLDIFTAATFLSLVFSVDKSASFLGYGGNLSDSFLFSLSLLAVFVLFLGVASQQGAGRVTGKIVGALVSSCFLVTLFSIPYYFGYNVLGLIGMNAGFSLVSAFFHAYAVYLLAMFFVVAYDFSYRSRGKRLRRWFDFLTLLLIFFNLLLIGWSAIYLVLFVLSAAAMVLGGLIEENRSSKPGNLMLAAMMVALLLFISGLDLGKLVYGQISFGDSAVSNMIKSSLHLENGAGEKGFASGEALAVAKSSVMNSPAVGSGVGTYYYDFFKYKTPAFNNDANWAIGYSKAYDEVLEKASTVGLIGLVSYLILVIFALLLFIRVLKQRKETIFFACAFLTLFIFQFLFLETAVLKFMFILLLFLAAALSAERAEGEAEPVTLLEINGRKLSGSLLFSAGVLAVLMSSLVAVFAIQAFRAEAKYKEVTSSKTPEKLSDADIASVMEINPFRSDYAAGISGVYMNRLYKLAASSSNDSAAASKVKSEADNALKYAKMAVDISPNNLFLWENYANVYQGMGYIGIKGAEDRMIENYEKALGLNPNDAILRKEIADVYVTKYLFGKSDQEAAKSSNTKSNVTDGELNVYLASAKKRYEEALTFKANYPDSALALAAVYGYQGNAPAALGEVDRASKMSDLSIASAIEIGKMYYNFGAKDRAENAMLSVVSIDPENADAHYILGVIYADGNQKDKAISQFNSVLKGNPGNADVTDRINKLNGQTSQSGSKTGDNNKN